MGEDENGKITLAVLSQQLLTLTAEVTALRADMRLSRDEATTYRILQSKHDTQIYNLGQDYESLSTRVNGWSIINSAGVVFAAILGIIFGNQKP